MMTKLVSGMATMPTTASRVAECTPNTNTPMSRRQREEDVDRAPAIRAATLAVGTSTATPSPVTRSSLA